MRVRERERERERTERWRENPQIKNAQGHVNKIYSVTSHGSYLILIQTTG